jgi:hypothetical protein
LLEREEDDELSLVNQSCFGEGGSFEGETSLKGSELLSGSGEVPVFKDRFLRACNHSFPSRVKFLIKIVIGGKRVKGYPKPESLSFPNQEW